MKSRSSDRSNRGLRPSIQIPASLVACGVVMAATNLGAAAGIRAGAVAMDITPSTPVTLAGYESRKDLSQGVHDPLSARVVAFELEGQRLVLVSTDTIGFYSSTMAAVRERILGECGLQPSELWLCAIHTHSGPSLTLDATRGHSNNVQYTESLRGRLVDAVRRALARLTPVQVGAGSGSSPVGVNRREVVPDGPGGTKVVLGRNPGVLTDREVQVLKVVPVGSSEPAAVLFAYATHSTSLGPRNYQVSGDVHGLAEQFLEQHLGGQVVAPAFAGASGDIDPWVRVLPGFNTHQGWIPEPVLLGTLLGEEVAQVSARIERLTPAGPVRTLMKTVLLPRKVAGEAKAAEDAPTLPFNVTVGRVGDVAFVGLGGEVFNAIGQAIKAASPFPHTFIFTHCNGAAGYVPVRSAYPEGGYEIRTTPFAAGADDRLRDAAVELLQGL